MVKYSIKNIIAKGFYSSLIGVPISVLVNILMLDWIVHVASTYNYYFSAVIVAMPFLITSAIRISVIDIIYQKYNIDLNPASLLKKIKG